MSELLLLIIVSFFHCISGLRSLLHKQETGTEFGQQLSKLVDLLSPKIYKNVEEQVLSYKNDLCDIH